MSRTQLSSSTSFYVDFAAGNDGNPGTALLPFKTPQGAMDFIFETIDHGGWNITVQLASGTYPGFETRGALSGHYGTPSKSYGPPPVGYTFLITGDPGVAANTVIIDGASGHAILTTLGKSLHVANLTVKSSSGCGIINRFTGGEIVIHNVTFDRCGQGHVYAVSGNNIFFAGDPCAITGDAQWFIYAEKGATIETYQPVTITCSGARTFTDFVAGAARCGVIDMQGGLMSFVVAPGGSVTGSKWRTLLNGVISTQTGNPDGVFPGTSNGSNLAGGQSN